MRRTIWLAMALPAVLLSATPVDVTDLQKPSGWMLALLAGVAVKICRTLRT